MLVVLTQWTDLTINMDHGVGHHPLWCWKQYSAWPSLTSTSHQVLEALAHWTDIDHQHGRWLRTPPSSGFENSTVLVHHYLQQTTIMQNILPYCCQKRDVLATLHPCSYAVVGPLDRHWPSTWTMVKNTTLLWHWKPYSPSSSLPTTNNNYAKCTPLLSPKTSCFSNITPV